jgi:hypothetical protein
MHGCCSVYVCWLCTLFRVVKASAEQWVACCIWKFCDRRWVPDPDGVLLHSARGRGQDPCIQGWSVHFNNAQHWLPTCAAVLMQGFRPFFSRPLHAASNPCTKPQPDTELRAAHTEGGSDGGYEIKLELECIPPPPRSNNKTQHPAQPISATL